MYRTEDSQVFFYKGKVEGSNPITVFFFFFFCFFIIFNIISFIFLDVMYAYMRLNI